MTSGVCSRKWKLWQDRGHSEPMDDYRRGDLVFDVVDEGSADGRRHDGGERRTSSREPSSPGAAARDVRAISEYGALTSALNWYRAIPLMDMRRQFHKITIPTM